MIHLLPARLRKMTLRMSLTGILLLVILPTLGVVAMALRNAGQSFEELSRLQLQQTANILARTTESELQGTARLLRATAAYKESLPASPDNSTAAIGGTVYALGRTAEGAWQTNPPLPEDMRETVLNAAVSGRVSVTDILGLPGAPADLSLGIAVTLPERDGDPAIRVAVLKSPLTDMVRALHSTTGDNSQVVLAVTDSQGRIIARSVGGEKLVGRPVPDWARLKALNTPAGSVRAKTLEGGGIIFAFREIAGTPGWMAVVGEAESSFDSRWQRPVIFMIAASVGTILIALALALTLTRSVLRPIRDLVARARQVAEGRSETYAGGAGESGIIEFETLRESLDAAEQVMAGRLARAELSEEVAQASLKRLTEAERLARIGSWELDVKTGSFSASEMMNELNGRGPDAPPLPMEELEKLVSPEDFRKIRAAIANCIETGQSYGFEAQHFRNDGSSFQVWLQGHARRDADGNISAVAGSMQDISERAEQNARLAALADNLPRGAILRVEHYDGDDTLRVPYVSGGIETLTGRSPHEITSNPEALGAAIHPDDRDEILGLLSDRREPGAQLEQQFRLIHVDGQVIWVRARAALRMNDPLRAIWDGLLMDISAERAAAEALESAKMAAEAAERAKSDFLATMSHEIRTPMNSVVGMTRLALKTQLDPRQRTYLEKINGSANVLLGIINDILDFSRIEAGGMELEAAPFRVDSVLETVASVNSLRAEEKGLELTFSVAPDVPGRLFGDSLRLSQVLTNLVGNAIKFTESGDVEVAIRRLSPPAGGGTRLQFSVRDTGIGLTEQQISGLFKPFAQANTDTARLYGGTGLGLAICQRLVAMMSGRISVTSTPGAGSTFSFTADFPESPAEEARAPSLRQTMPYTIQGRSVLIVDDNATARIALSEMVAGFGMKYDAASGGREALDMLRARELGGNPYDVLLLDWRMPEMDGIELARAIRGDSALSRVPAILMVTAYGHQLALTEAGDVGLQGVLLKPVTQSVIFNTLMHALVPEEGRPRELRQPDEADLGNFAVRLAGKRVLVVDDNALNREVASEFLALVGVITERAADGREAIEQLERNTYDAVLMDVHMPVMNGLEAIRIIRSRPQWAKLPVIALTAQARVEDELISREAGMDGHLTKPIDENLLYRTLIELMPAGQATLVAPPVPPAAAVVDARMAQIARRFGGSLNRLSRFLDGFLRDFGEMDHEYAALAAAGDLTALADYAHRVKGVVGYVEATELYVLSGDIENAARAGDRAMVEAAGPELLRLMRECLDGVRATAEKISEEAAPPPAPEAATPEAADLRARLDAILPLVSRADFSAHAMLEALINSLSAGALRDQIAAAKALFDDLETEAAAAALQVLRRRLEGGPV